jgi:hypothetical protein
VERLIYCTSSQPMFSSKSVSSSRASLNLILLGLFREQRIQEGWTWPNHRPLHPHSHYFSTSCRSGASTLTALCVPTLVSAGQNLTLHPRGPTGLWLAS